MARLRFGAALPSQRKAAEAFHAACTGAKIDCELAEDIERVLWEKFVLLVAISATTAVTRKTIGVVRADPDLRWLLETVMRETWAVGRKRGVALADDLVAKTLAQADTLRAARCAPRWPPTSRPAASWKRLGSPARWRAWRRKPGSRRPPTALCSPR